MASDNESQPPLINDPAREAAASMRGYFAQIWRSVLAWLDLRDKEWLYLEGAEDIDRISGLDAETTQVKDVSANITLRSADVIAAIDNAWAHQQRNPQHTIKFRFLTTAGIGIEQGAPFGAGLGGLKLWRDSRSSGEKTDRERYGRAIAQFLLAEGKVSAGVQAFLRSASDEQIWQRIIAPIEWDTDAEGTAEVIREIKNRLAVLGESYGVTPGEAGDVAEHLYATAYETATREKDRSLTRAELLQLFQDRTRVSLPTAFVNALVAAFPQHLKPGGPTPVAVGRKSDVVGRPPPLPARYYARQTVLTDIMDRLSSYPILVLQGGTGVGKSVAALGHITESTLSWGWADLRDVSNLAEALNSVVAQLEAEDGLTHIVLDDVEPPPDPRSLETPLARMKTILEERGGQLLITSPVELPQRLSLALALPENATMSISHFSLNEITEFLIERGCPTGEIAGWEATFVELHTSGHAQLVHARIATLEAQGFPIPDVESLMVTPSDVVEARAEARRLITILDGPIRELIYRLSLTAHAVPRRQVFAIARQSPAVAEPRLVLDRLVGPWLEVIADGFYRVSPLLRGVGAEVQGAVWAKAMNADIALAILKFRTLSPTDFSAVLFHAIAAQDWLSIARLSIGLLKSDNETWGALAQSANWFVLVATGSATRPDTDVFSLSLIRLLQLRLAAGNHDSEKAACIIACMNEELPATVKEVPLRVARYFLLGQIQLCTEVITLPITQLVSMGSEFIRLTDELKDVLAGIHNQASDLPAGPDDATDFDKFAGFTLVPQLTDRNRLAALLEACERLDPDIVRRFLGYIGSEESIAQLVFVRVLVSEFGSAAPDWPACRKVLQRAYSFARHNTLPGLSQGAARAIAQLTDEFLNDPEEALRLADEMAAEIGRSPSLEDERATILLHKGDAAGALAIWRELLPRWPPRSDFDLQQMHSHRLAAVAAARLGEWTEAANWLREARALAGHDNEAIYRAGLSVDEGFARWKGGNNRDALDCLVQGLTAIDALPPDDIDEEVYLLRKRVGHTMMYIARSALGTPPQEVVEPPPACCSTLEPANEARMPSTPNDAMWLHILEFEFFVDLGDGQFRTYEARLRASRYGLIRFNFDGLRLRRRLQSLSLDDFVEVVCDWVRSFDLCQRYYKEDGLHAADPLPADAIPADLRQADSEMLLGWLLSAVFALAARGTITRDALDGWRANTVDAGASGIIDPWLSFVVAIFVDDTIKAEAVMYNKALAWPWQAVASIKVAIDATTGPSKLLMAHYYWTITLSKTPPGLFVLPDIEHLVTNAWRHMSENGFLLRSPRLTAPALQEACASSSTGWRKIGEVLTAACDLVPGNVPSEYREKFEALKFS